MESAYCSAPNLYIRHAYVLFLYYLLLHILLVSCFLKMSLPAKIVKLRT